MKYKRTQTTGKAGVIFLECTVNEHGSVFRPVHQEDDVGIDGFIELVDDENASGRLIAVQVKSGDSYLSADKEAFLVNVDDDHVDYWIGFMVPVILVCFSPSLNRAAWTSVHDYVAREKYMDRLPVKSIRIPLYDKFDVNSLNEGVAGLAHAWNDERTLLKSVDMCLSFDLDERHRGFQILASHPDSRGSKTTCYLARKLIDDERDDLVKDCLFILGYGVGRRRWSWNPMNRDEGDIVGFASSICEDLTDETIYRLLTLCDNEGFRGPQALGERLFDVACCCFDVAEGVFDRVVSDRSEPMQRRANALYMLFECMDDELEDAEDRLRSDDRLRDVAEWIFRPPDNI